MMDIMVRLTKKGGSSLLTKPAMHRLPTVLLPVIASCPLLILVVNQCAHLGCLPTVNNLVQTKIAKQQPPQTQTSLPRIYMHNILSLNHQKFVELQTIAQNHDIIVLIESWL